MTAYSQPPLKVIRAFSLDDGTALVHLHNLSGGVLGGDRLETAISVGPQARVQLTSTGATRLYRSRPDAAPAVQVYNLRVGANARVEFLPDPLIPFAGARYDQETTITLESGAGLFWWETVMSGREAHGERFAFERLEFKLDIVAEGRPRVRERVRLQPAERPLTSLTRLGPYQVYTSFYVCQVGLDPARWMALEAQLSILAQQMTRQDAVVWGVSALPAHGLAVRGVSRASRALADGLMQFWRAAKQLLYQQEAVLPRKTY